MGFVPHGETFSSVFLHRQNGKLMTLSDEYRDPRTIALLTPLMN